LVSRIYSHPRGAKPFIKMRRPNTRARQAWSATYRWLNENGYGRFRTSELRTGRFSSTKIYARGRDEVRFRLYNNVPESISVTTDRGNERSDFAQEGATLPPRIGPRLREGQWFRRDPPPPVWEDGVLEYGPENRPYQNLANLNPRPRYRARYGWARLPNFNAGLQEDY